MKQVDDLSICAAIVPPRYVTLAWDKEISQLLPAQNLLNYT